ncbi:MAG: helix-turn-helix transcriptional regulator [Planctomycetes bacterium]|nr:helix-turn-helix transcriptional regulator [Planctomycetota bacterium]MCH8118607.1 helix-turn-helix transcriptional regulator [Planctomycetota bacterium]
MVFAKRQWEYLRKCWHLTPREIEVAKLVCKDFDNDSIADKLHIEYNTVRAHLGNVFRKMGVRGKTSVILEFIDVLRKAKI